MYRTIFKLCIVFSIVSPILPVQNNYLKYNVDQESYKLYGEDFKSVLKRFRRTPDYLKILQDKLGDLKITAKEMSLQVLHYYHNKLEERVNEEMPSTTTVPEVAHSQVEDPKAKVYIRVHGNRRQREPATDAVEDSLQKIRNLDSYKMFDSLLSVAERNSFKDLGFEYAGKIIHAIIENMSQKPSTGSTENFTHAPESVEKAGDTTTTTHPSVHAEIHKETDPETVTEATSPSSETFRLR